MVCSYFYYRDANNRKYSGHYLHAEKGIIFYLVDLFKNANYRYHHEILLIYRLRISVYMIQDLV